MNYYFSVYLRLMSGFPWKSRYNVLLIAAVREKNDRTKIEGDFIVR